MRQKVYYHDVRKTFGLPAQIVIRMLANVGDAYTLDTQIKRVGVAHMPDSSD